MYLLNIIRVCKHFALIKTSPLWILVPLYLEFIYTGIIFFSGGIRIYSYIQFVVFIQKLCIFS